MELIYTGTYKGIVIQNDDPAQKGRVKVWVPHVNATMYGDWNELLSKVVGESVEQAGFAFLGENTSPDVMPLLLRLKESLPWAEQVQPLVGSGVPGFYIADNREASVSYGNEQTSRVFETCGEKDPNDTEVSTAEEEIQMQSTILQDKSKGNSEQTKQTFVPKYTNTAQGETDSFRTQADPYAVGAISTGSGDLGGKSYGTYQFPSNTKVSNSLTGFVNSPSNPFSATLKAAGKIGSAAFDATWKSLATTANRAFGLAQEEFARNVMWAPIISNFETRSGIKLDQHAPILTDLIVGTANQYGNITNNIADYVKTSGGKNLTTNEVGKAVQDYKYKNVDNNFKRSSESVRNGVRKRIEREREPFEEDQNDKISSQSLANVPENNGDAVPPPETTPATPQGMSMPACFVGANQAHVFAQTPVADAYAKVGGEKTENSFANPYSAGYKPADYHNAPRGFISILGVGAHVTVVFEGGNPMCPMITGVLYGGDDYKHLYQASEESPGTDYPGAFENKEKEDEDQPDDNVYRGKTVLNERGGSIEVISTANREEMRLTHFSGSMMRFTNVVTARLATGNDQLLVMGDTFTTTGGNESRHTGQSYDHVVLGDSIRKVGPYRQWKEASDQFKGAVEPIQDIKKLFDLKRVDQQGKFCPCPVCSQKQAFIQVTTISADKLVEGETLQVGPGNLWGPSAKVIEPGEYTVDTIQGEKGPDADSETPEAMGLMGGLPCWNCGGTGLSPSTQDGEWEPEDKKKELKDKIVDLTEQLAAIEDKFGTANTREGGNDFEYIAKQSTMIVGTTFNDFDSIRVDPVGKFAPAGWKVADKGVYPVFAPVPLVESIHVQDLPGGDREEVICNRKSVLVGAGGVRLRTVGNLNVTSQAAYIASAYLNVTSMYGVAIDAGKRFDVEAEVISLRPRERETKNGKVKEVTVEGSLSVAENALIRGGLHVEGELTTQHIIAPRELRLTEVERVITKANMLPGFIIGTISMGEGESAITMMVTSVSCVGCIEIDPHVHWYDSIASTLVSSNDAVRHMALNGNIVGITLANSVASAVTYPEETWAQDEGGTHPVVFGTHDPEMEGKGPGTAFTGSESKDRKT